MSRTFLDRESMAWTGLTATGFASGMVIAIISGEPVGHILPKAWIATVFGMMALTVTLMCIGGSVLGTAQWIRLRTTLSKQYRWIVVTALGLGFGVSLSVAFVEHAGEYLAGHPLRFLALPLGVQLVSVAIVGALAGVILGGSQALVLRANSQVRSRWVARSFIALTLSLPISLLATTVTFGTLSSFSGFAAFLLLAGALLGAFTGMPNAARSSISVAGI
jgi:hypothetical protein